MPLSTVSRVRYKVPGLGRSESRKPEKESTATRPSMGCLCLSPKQSSLLSPFSVAASQTQPLGVRIQFGKALVNTQVKLGSPSGVHIFSDFKCKLSPSLPMLYCHYMYSAPKIPGLSTSALKNQLGPAFAMKVGKAGCLWSYLPGTAPR